MIREIKDMAVAKYNQDKVDRQLTRKLVDKVGSQSDIGGTNYDYYYRTIKGMVKNNKQADAANYANQEGTKVLRQKNGR